MNFLKVGEADAAIAHLRQALHVRCRLLCRLEDAGQGTGHGGNHAEAVDVLGQGIEVAERRGDVQAAKEMGVFRKRSQKALDGAA